MSLAWIGLWLACSGVDVSVEEPPAAADVQAFGGSPEEVAAVANEIAAGGEVSAVLGARGLTEAALEALLVEIAKDPAKTEAYLAARR